MANRNLDTPHLERLDAYIDLDRYPIHDLDSPAGKALIADINDALEQLPALGGQRIGVRHVGGDFLREAFLQLLFEIAVAVGVCRLDVREQRAGLAFR